MVKEYITKAHYPGWDDLLLNGPVIDSPERIKEIQAYEAYESYSSEIDGDITE
jgi:hypothetical protein